MQSEYRLWLFTLSIPLVPGGLILWGAGAAHHVHWFGLIFAMGLIGFINTVGLQLSITYCIDSYRELSGEAMVTVILIRNTMSFAIGYGQVVSFSLLHRTESDKPDLVSRRGSHKWDYRMRSSSLHSLGWRKSSLSLSSFVMAKV